MLEDGVSYRVGSVRLRQLRVKPGFSIRTCYDLMVLISKYMSQCQIYEIDVLIIV